jgi:hypothetical protein
MYRKWKKDVTARAKKGTIEKGKKRKVVEVFDMDFLYLMVPDDADDDDYEEEEEGADNSGDPRRWETRSLRRRRTRV